MERWFAGVLVSDLSLSLLNMVYADLREEHGMSQRGVHKLNAVMSQVMDLAVKERLTEHNPCRDVEVSRPRSAERTPLTLEEAISLCQALHDDELDGRRVAIWLALATGVRRGEALGLTWRYVDFDNMRVFIKYQYIKDKTLRETKNRRSRWIAIDDGTARYLRTWKAVQARRMQVQGIAQTPDAPVCSDSDFGFHDPDNFSTWQRGYFIEHGLGRMEEAEEGGRKRRLGHEVSSMTMDVYAHSPHAADNRTPEQNRIIELERENKRLRTEVDVLKQAAPMFARKRRR